MHSAIKPPIHPPTPNTASKTSMNWPRNSTGFVAAERAAAKPSPMKKPIPHSSRTTPPTVIPEHFNALFEDFEFGDSEGFVMSTLSKDGATIKRFIQPN